MVHHIRTSHTTFSRAGDTHCLIRQIHTHPTRTITSCTHVGSSAASLSKSVLLKRFRVQVVRATTPAFLKCFPFAAMLESAAFTQTDSCQVQLVHYSSSKDSSHVNPPVLAEEMPFVQATQHVTSRAKLLIVQLCYSDLSRLYDIKRIRFIALLHYLHASGVHHRVKALLEGRLRGTSRKMCPALTTAQRVSTADHISVNALADRQISQRLP
jgi:hypothetical protein